VGLVTAAERQAKYRESRKAEEQALLAAAVTAQAHNVDISIETEKSAGHGVNERSPTDAP
jgi:hypothetical protein